MKILLIFVLYLISGPVSCFDVLGCPGREVIIICRNDIYQMSGTLYFCKKKSLNNCEAVISTQTQLRGFNAVEGRFKLEVRPEGIKIIIMKLELQDTGEYECGQSGVWNHDMFLNISTGPSCTEPKTITSSLGDTVPIRCNYPEMLVTKVKFLYKLFGHKAVEIIRTGGPTKDRLFISDDRRAKVLSVNISDVRESDAGHYYCALLNGDESVHYYFFFTEIQLHVTDQERNPSETPQRDTALFGVPVIITVCVALLLIGGFALMFYKVRYMKIKGSTLSPTIQEISRTSEDDYENDPGNQNIVMGQIHQSLNPNINQSDSVYQSLNPNTKQSDSIYQSLTSKIKQSDSVYQRLCPNTNQSDSGYQSLNPNPNQSV